MKIILSPLAKINVKKLSKKYKSTISDIDLFIKRVRNNEDFKTDRVQGIKLPIYKTRIKNSSINQGKSGGFRVMYHVKVNDILYILSIYSKNTVGNIDKKDIISSLKDLDL
jgi:mRNA-degrading endonuclease RelE of RelBE toxin-antitoxin system